MEMGSDCQDLEKSLIPCTKFKCGTAYDVSIAHSKGTSSVLTFLRHCVVKTLFTALPPRCSVGTWPRLTKYAIGHLGRPRSLPLTTSWT
jgi:hypothetical protein